jgi:uncharacterized protein YbjT (DUF2867 family)
MDEKQLILITGATGYIGGRLIPRLLEKGYRIRCLVRDPSRLIGRPWERQVELVIGDALDPECLPSAVKDVKLAYYLIHSMKSGRDFKERDIQAAANFGKAAREAGVGRIIYLGGLGDPESQLSIHLRSRQTTGEALRQFGVPVCELRAPVIIGSGSLSFEIMRYLTERVPIIVCPRLVYNRIQPIAVADVLNYLLAALDTPESADQIIEIGGADVLTYKDMMLGYAKARGLKRVLIPIPVPNLLLFTNWFFFDSPIPSSIARPLIEGLKNESIVRSNTAQQFFPNIHPMSYDNAVEIALDQLEAGLVETAWTDALINSQGDIPPKIMESVEGMIMENRQLLIDTPAPVVFRTVSGLGGNRGWLYLNWVWQVRGMIDILFGGVGLRRGRRDPVEVRCGDAVDFWRVEAIEPDRLLRFRAEMKVPGRAWLQFQVHPHSSDKSVLQQTAYFAPKGLGGVLYWYLLYPVHTFIFSGMIHKIAEQAIINHAVEQKINHEMDIV